MESTVTDISFILTHCLYFKTYAGAGVLMNVIRCLNIMFPIL